MALKTNSRLVLYSSDRELELGFDRLKGEALHYVYEGYPVGDYYEAALPGRDAFCMRDTSHQCMGAQALGLGSHNFNMLKKFAEAIDESRDFCSYWEIDRWDRPCPVDYKDDADFWYNLPANFDVIDAILRMYRWSGDKRYLTDPAFERFCALTMEQYIARWDRDGDGIPDRVLEEGRRGIASYDERKKSVQGLRVGTDLVCSMVRAYESVSELNRLAKHPECAAIYKKRGEALKNDLITRWYDAEKGVAFGLGLDGQMVFLPHDPWHQKDFLYRGLANAEQAKPILDALEEKMDDTIIELFSHLPEILWRYGREEAAVRAIRRAMDKNLSRRDYPEASYCAIGAIVSGMMGIDPDGEHDRVRTLSGLADIERVQLLHVQVLDGSISVEHEGHDKTKLENECSHEITWRACFEGECCLFLNGVQLNAQTEVMPCSGRLVTFADIAVGAGETACVEAKA